MEVSLRLISPLFSKEWRPLCDSFLLYAPPGYVTPPCTTRVCNTSLHHPGICQAVPPGYMPGCTTRVCTTSVPPPGMYHQCTTPGYVPGYIPPGYVQAIYHPGMYPPSHPGYTTIYSPTRYTYEHCTPGSRGAGKRPWAQPLGE